MAAKPLPHTHGGGSASSRKIAARQPGARSLPTVVGPTRTLRFPMRWKKEPGERPPWKSTARHGKCWLSLGIGVPLPASSSRREEQTPPRSVFPASSRCSSYSPEPIGPAAPEWASSRLSPRAPLAPRKLGSWRSSRVDPCRRDGWWSAAAARRGGGRFRARRWWATVRFGLGGEGARPSPSPSRAPNHCLRGLSWGKGITILRLDSWTHRNRPFLSSMFIHPSIILTYTIHIFLQYRKPFIKF
jgi:hypothetical protein